MTMGCGCVVVATGSGESGRDAGFVIAWLNNAGVELATEVNI